MVAPTGFEQLQGLDEMGDLAPVLKQHPEVVDLIPIFGGLTPQEVESIARMMRVYFAKEDTVIFREGEPGDAMLLVVEGYVQVLKGDPSDRVTLGILDRGKTLGEMSLIDQQPRSATCLAIHDCMFAALSTAGLERLIREQPKLGAIVLKHVALMLSMRLRRANESVGDEWNKFMDV
jgi:CRP/FNR family transcriptional regulator, cyclic AMP receptor protein